MSDPMSDPISDPISDKLEKPRPAALDGLAQWLGKRPPRFYRRVTVSGNGGVWRVLLDGRLLRTPGKRELDLPGEALAHAIAAEWLAQADRIDPHTMPLTKLANTAIDRVIGREAAIVAEILAYANADLLCYRADAQEGLVRRQGEVWDPVLEWVRASFNAPLLVTAGVMHVPQPAASLEKLREEFSRRGPFALTALHVMTTLLGSAILALAHAGGRLSLDAAWAAANVDEDWQSAHWGQDAEAGRRRERRFRDMASAARFLSLPGP